MAKPPALDRQLAELIEHVLACERLERVQDRLDHAAPAVHHCHLPGPGQWAWRWTCPCGQR